ncbi:alpha-hydroxy acid oxidase [Alisedimentitalea sp. MJ-SS2]|uniref:alpha-hydroxy acid oxidase n=1 Tax=Aliisedimentitalea sp. MJ-SS2 TaxID=3049795 RepID=UPI00290F3155|nr:alpha-hydroxy acid oxidase [Alisedimentitalea sp. MJ-SS2]MDU8929215.1 alpha-hydroxy acid oxidase [Alisedimentitalea sp. MJ-SS2]
MRASRIFSAADARRIAKRRLPWMVFDYFNGTAGGGTGADRTREAFDRITLMPRILRDVSGRRIASSVFGGETGGPFGIAPMGMCNLAAPGADLMLARLAARKRVPHVVSTVASTPLERIIEVAEGNAWFQLYFSGDGSQGFKLAKRAGSAGYETLVLTVDVPEVGRRHGEMRHGFKFPFRIGPRQFVDFMCHPRWSIPMLLSGRPKMANFEMQGYGFDRAASRAKTTWDVLKKLREEWSGTLVVKGVMDAGDARKLQGLGVDAIQVSNHGARQLESSPTPISSLPDLRQATGRETPLFYDSGLQSGEDILKALRSGADFAFVGRILLFAIAASGEEGLNRMWTILEDELSNAMAQIGLDVVNPLNAVSNSP